MNRHLVLYVVLCLLALATSCSIMEKKEIETSALGYLEAVNKDDFAEAYKYSDDDTKELIDFLEEVYKSSNSDTSARTIDDINVSILHINITSDSTAEVGYQTHQNNVLIDDNVLSMKKIDDKWLVHQSKESCTSALFQNVEE